MARKNWIPAHSIIVVRGEKGAEKQIDAYTETNGGKKAFSFTDDEVKEIQALDPTSLIAPDGEETVDGDDVAGTPVPTEAEKEAAAAALAKPVKPSTKPKVDEDL